MKKIRKTEMTDERKPLYEIATMADKREIGIRVYEQKAWVKYKQRSCL